MSGTSVPNITFGPNGFVAPLESAILEGVQADNNAAFGGNLNPALNTPQGQWATSEAAVIGDGYNQQVTLFNTVDPAYAFGRMQDAIGRIYFMTRIASEPTVLQIVCGGQAGVAIPFGALINDPSGNIYFCSDPGTIGSGGTVTLSFSCQITGPVAVPASVTIYQSIPQWDAVAVSSGVVGRNVESRAAFETRRQQSVAANSRNTNQAILGAVLAVSGVLSAYVYSNDTAAPVTIKGVTLAANAVYVAAVGGTSAAVAQAIWSKKPPGSPYYSSANTSVVVLDTSPGYVSPYPSYTVKFEIPPGLTIFFAVNIVNSAAVPSNAATLVANAILAAMAGSDGGPPATIGGTVYASRFYAGIAALGAWAQIIDILVGSVNVPTCTFTGIISGTALTTSAATGTIAIGQAVVGTGVADGTYIVSGSGTSWVVSISQTVGSEAMSGIAPAAYSVAANINQIPVATTLDVVLTLT
jgi:hypothetical protein